MKLPKILNSQKGVISPLLIFIAAIGLIAFLFATNTLDFKDQIYSLLYPKPPSEARGPHRPPRPTPTPTPTPKPTPTPTPTPSPITSNKPGVGFLATNYDSVKSKVIAGDEVTMSVARQQGYPDTPISSSVFNSAVSTLNGISSSGGIKKSLIFSSTSDIKTFINQVPSNVEVAYNSEGGLTPASERVDFYSTVKDGASVVHAAGKKFAFAPLRSDFDSLQSNGTLAKILPLIDGTGYQGQLLYLSVGEDQTVATAKEKFNYVKSINPKASFQFQMWVGRETDAQIISTFNKMVGFMDIAVIGGASASDITTIISGLSWR